MKFLRKSSFAVLAVSLAGSLAFACVNAGDGSEEVSADLNANAGSSLVISQIFGGGGATSAAFAYDYVELFNRGNAPVSLDGLSLQYAGGGANFQRGDAISLGNATVPPGGYYLVRMDTVAALDAGPPVPVRDRDAGAPARDAGGGGTVMDAGGTAMDAGGTVMDAGGTAMAAGRPEPREAPRPDLIARGSMSADKGKLAIVASDSLLHACGKADAQCTTPWRDFVGYGDATQAETKNAPETSKLLAGFRKGNGCIDTNDNAANFELLPPDPRDSASPLDVCPDTRDAGSLGDAGGRDAGSRADASAPGADSGTGETPAPDGSAPPADVDASAPPATADASASSTSKDAGTKKPTPPFPDSELGEEPPEDAGKGLKKPASAGPQKEGPEAGCSMTSGKTGAGGLAPLAGLGVVLAFAGRRRRR